MYPFYFINYEIFQLLENYIIARVVACSMQILDMYLPICIGRYSASSWKYIKAERHMLQLAEDNGRYSALYNGTRSACKFDTLLRQADKMVMISVISQDTDYIKSSNYYQSYVAYIKTSHGIETQ